MWMVHEPVSLTNLASAGKAAHLRQDGVVIIMHSDMVDVSPAIVMLCVVAGPATVGGKAERLSCWRKHRLAFQNTWSKVSFSAHCCNMADGGRSHLHALAH